MEFQKFQILEIYLRMEICFGKLNFDTKKMKN